MIYQARTENAEMFIAMYETEEPRKFTTLANLSTTKEWDEWQSSKREYEVREGNKEEVINLLKGEYALNPKYHNGDSWQTWLANGIDCTFLKDRLKLEKYCSICDEHNTPNSVICWACRRETIVQYWTLLPLEDKKENEANILKDKLEEALQLLLKLSNKPHFFYVDEVKGIAKLIHEAYNNKNEAVQKYELSQFMVDYWTMFPTLGSNEELASRLLDKYAITRNPTIQEPE